MEKKLFIDGAWVGTRSTGTVTNIQMVASKMGA